MPRLFTGLEIPADVSAALGFLRGGLPGARWINPESYHVTLRFIGDVESIVAREIDRELARIQGEAFEAVLDAPLVFGGAKPRALVALVKRTPPLLELQADQNRLMKRIGLPSEQRKFTPHVTLARLKGVSSAAAAEHLNFLNFFSPRRFIARRFVLFSARESVGGGPYVVEAAYPLAAPDGFVSSPTAR